MIKLLFFLALLFASVWLGVQLHGDPGYILIIVNHWRIESTVWVGLGAVLLSFALLHLFLSSYHRAIHLPRAWQAFRRKRKLRIAHDKTTQGLIEFSEGYWHAAKTHLIQALPHSETPLINYLMAARAAQELGDTNLRDQYLRAAQRSMPDAKIAVELTQAQLQLAHKQWEQALATLRHLHDLAPKHPYVLKLLARLYDAIEDWAHLIQLLPAITKNAALPQAQLEPLTHKAYLERTKQHIEQQNFGILDHFIKDLPKPLRNNPEIMATYATALIAQKKNTDAELCLRRALQKHITPQLIESYSTLPAEIARVRFIESLLKEPQYKAELHICLGALYIKQQLFGKAQTQIEDSLALKKSPEAYLMLGELLERLNHPKEAFDAYKDGLNAAIKSP